MPNQASIEEKEIFLWTNGVLTLLSFFGDLYILKKYNTIVKSKFGYKIKLLAMIALTNILYCFCNALTFVDELSVMICQIEGFIRQSSMLSIIIWVIFMLLAVRMSEYKEKYHNISQTKILVYLITINVTISMIPGIIVLVMGINGGPASFGYHKGYCTILPAEYNLYIFELPAWGLNLFLTYISVSNYMQARNSYKEDFRIKTQKSVVFSGVLLAIMIPPLVDIIYQFLEGSSPYWLFLLHYSSLRIIGFVYALIFRSQYKNYWHKKGPEDESLMTPSSVTEESEKSNSWVGNS